MKWKDFDFKLKKKKSATLEDDNAKDNITLVIEDKSLSFNKKDFIEIEKYIEGSFDPEIEIDRMKLTYLGKIDNNEYYIIHYGGGMKASNDLLVRKNRNIRGYQFF